MGEPPVDRGHTPPLDRRRRLWEIDTRLHCSVIGTCLTLGDLRRIERRLKIEPLKDATDFQIHGNFVVWAGQPGPVAKQMHKLLDRRYAVTIRRFAAAATAADVAGLWQTSRQDGDIPGPYWALLTHPAASEAQRMRAFGEVHMLSHLVGAANRTDIRRLMALEGECDALTEALAAAKRRQVQQERDGRRRIDQHAAEVRALTNRLSSVAALEMQVRQMEAQLHAFASGETHAALHAEVQDVRGQLAAAEERLVRAAAQNAALVTDNRRLQEAAAHNERTLHAVNAECDAIERLLREHLACACDDGTDTAAPAGEAIDLCGRRIVYVGGLGCVVPHLRALVERCGGIFLHHDGGLEEQTSRLDGVLGKGDVVFCPIDCVSHDACLRAKRACRQRATTFVPLRTCSLSSFADGLRHLAGSAASKPATDGMHHTLDA